MKKTYQMPQTSFIFIDENELIATSCTTDSSPTGCITDNKYEDVIFCREDYSCEDDAV